MQTFKFSKMHGAGNDYIYVNCFEEKAENINDTAKAGRTCFDMPV